MGRMYAEGLRESGLNVENQVTMHLRHNCYPPVPYCMVPVAVKAIDRYYNEDAPRIRLPEGVAFRDGSKLVTAAQVINSLRLHAFVEGDY